MPSSKGYWKPYIDNINAVLKTPALKSQTQLTALECEVLTSTLENVYRKSPSYSNPGELYLLMPMMAMVLALQLIKERGKHEISRI